MCTGGDSVPGSAAEPLSMMGAALDYLMNGPAGDLVQPAALGEVLQALAGVSAKHAAARMRLVSRFDASDCHDSDGYPTTGRPVQHQERPARRRVQREHS
jgi:hypothetical protein